MDPQQPVQPPAQPKTIRRGMATLTVGADGKPTGISLGGNTFQNAWSGIKGGAESLASGLASPYTDAASANEQAGRESESLGREALDMAGAGINRALDQTTPAARQWARTYEGDGELAGKGALEKLYDTRAGGTNPALEYDRKMGTQAIDNAFAARGLQNSGAALKAVGNLNENISAENQRQLASLAQGAQGAQETRLGGAFDRVHGLGQGRAGIVQSGTQGGIDSYTAGKMGGIQARLAAANNMAQLKGDSIKAGANFGGKLWGAVT
jgi:hypothetical protein